MSRSVYALASAALALMAACSSADETIEETRTLSLPTLPATRTEPPSPTYTQPPAPTPWELSASLPELAPSHLLLDTPDGILAFAVNTGDPPTKFPTASVNLSPSEFDRGYFDVSPQGDLIAIAQVRPYPVVGLQSSIRLLSLGDSHSWQVAPKGSNFPSWSPDGASIAYVDYFNTRICLASRESPYRCLPQHGFFAYGRPAWSPDETLIAYCADIKPGECDVFTEPLAGGEPFLIASNGGDPEWSPVQSHLTFSSCSGDGCVLQVADLQACQAAAPQCITPLVALGNVSSAEWSPDGARLVIRVVDEDGGSQLQLIDSACLDDPSTCPAHTIALTHPSFAIGGYVWSPDGKAIAYVGRRAISLGIYITLADGSATALVAEIDGGFIPMLQWAAQ